MSVLDNPTDVSPIAIVAGNGMLPVEIAQSLTERGIPFFIAAIRGEGHDDITQYPHEWWTWEKLGLLFRLLKQYRSERVVLAGGVIGRPEFKITMLDWGALRTVPGLLAAVLGGDDTILSSVIGVFEKKGYTVCSVADLVPELLVASGANTRLKPSSGDVKRIVEGIAVTAAMGRFDIGQGCVVVGKRAVALEGAEGTDAMLRRVSELRDNNRLPAKRGGVLIKAVKPGQDERADLPAIGPDTIRAVHAANLSGIGVQAGKTLMIEKEETLAEARRLKVFIFGFDSEDPKFSPSPVLD